MLSTTLFLVAALAQGRIETGRAGTYGPGYDSQDTGRTACRRALIASRGLAGYQQALARGLAHRTLPCGTNLLVCTKSRCVYSTVVDRGPYIAVTPAGHYLGPRPQGLRRGEVWRGIVDLRVELARRVGLSGRGWVVIRRL